MSCSKQQFRLLLLLWMGALVLAGVGGCQESATEPEGDIPETNLFPLAVGRQWVFTAYDLDTLNSQKISATEHREVSRIPTTISVGGKTGYLMVDDTYSPQGALVESDSTLFVVENGDLYVWMDDFPSPPSWVPLFKRSAGLNTTYDIAQYQLSEGGQTFSFKLQGKVNPKEAVSTPLGSLQAYKFELTTSITALGLTFTATEYLFFADGYGLVKRYTPVQREPFSGMKSEGQEALLQQKNF